MDLMSYFWLYENIYSWGVWLILIALKSFLILALFEFLISSSACFFSAAARHVFRLFSLSTLFLLPVFSLGFPQWNLSLIERPVKSNLVTLQEISLAPETEQLSKKNKGWHERDKLQTHGIDLIKVQSNYSGKKIVTTNNQFEGYWERLSFENLLFSTVGLVTIIWCIGSLILIILLFLGIASIWRIRLRSMEICDSNLRWLASVVVSRLRVRRTVKIYRTPGLEVALSVGIIKPAVLLPAVSTTWSDNRMRSILLHEYAHADRMDNLSNLISELACIFFWVNPIVWLTSRQLRIDREKACDDRVLELGIRPSEYASHLLDVARAISSRRLWGSLEVSQSSVLKDRFQTLLSPGVNRGVLSKFATVKAFFLMIFVFLPISILDPWKNLEIEINNASLFLSLEGAKDDWKNLRRSNKRRSPVFNPTSSKRSRPSSTENILSLEKKQEIEIPGRILSDRLSVSKLIGRDKRRSLNQVVTTNYAVNRSENSKRMDRLREVFQKKGDFSRLESSREEYQQASIGTIPFSQIYYDQHETQELENHDKSGFLPSSEHQIKVAEVVSYDLGTLGETSEATDINDHGTVVGQSRTVYGVVHPFLWTQEVGMVDLAENQEFNTRAIQINSNNHVLCEAFDTYVFQGYVWSLDNGFEDLGALNLSSPLTIPKSMNENGHVVGSSRGPRGMMRAFFWTSAIGMMDIGAPGWSEALAINGLEQVVGHSDNRAFIWAKSKGLRYIGPEKAVFSVATSLNRHGEVVGWARYEGGESRAFYWNSDRGFIDLGRLNSSFPLSMAYEIGDHGVVVGHCLGGDNSNQGHEVHAFRWTLDTGMESLGRVPNNSCISLNSLGQIVGTSLLASEIKNSLAFLWTEKGCVAFQVTPEYEGSPSEGIAINNHGQIAGNTLISDGSKRANLWEIRFLVLEAESYK